MSALGSDRQKLVDFRLETASGLRSFPPELESSLGDWLRGWGRCLGGMSASGSAREDCPHSPVVAGGGTSRVGLPQHSYQSGHPESVDPEAMRNAHPHSSLVTLSI
jgi:hypothetical protein